MRFICNEMTIIARLQYLRDVTVLGGMCVLGGGVYKRFDITSCLDKDICLIQTFRDMSRYRLFKVS